MKKHTHDVLSSTVARRRVALVGVSVLLTTAAIGCADTDFEGECTVESLANGSMEVRCPDGAQTVINDVVPDGTCKASVDANGTTLLVCPDGTTLELPKPPVGTACVETTDVAGNVLLTCGTTTVSLRPGCPDGFPGSFGSGGRDGGNSSIGERALLEQIFVRSTCTKIQGNVRVGHGYGEDVSEEFAEKLRGITEIGGNLSIDLEREERLTMPNLVIVGGNMTVEAYNDVEGFDAPKLRRVVETLVLSSESPDVQFLMPALTSARTVEILGGRHDNLTATLEAMAPTLEGLSLERLPMSTIPDLGTFPRLQRIHISDMPSLTSVGASINAVSLEWLELSYLPSLVTAPAFPNLVTAERIYLESLPAGLTLPVFVKLKNVGLAGTLLPSQRGITLSTLDQVKIAIFPELTDAYSITLDTLPALTDMPLMPKLTDIHSGLFGSNVGALVSFDGVPALKRVGESINFYFPSTLLTCAVWGLYARLEAEGGLPDFNTPAPPAGPDETAACP